MILKELYDLADKIEKRKEVYFVIYDSNGTELIGIEVFDWESEDCLDSGWFTEKEAVDFLLEYEKNYD